MQKIQKIILTKSIVLNKLPVPAGSNGVIIVEQDSVGGHIITLAEGNIGFVDIAFNPGGITELHWSVDDVKTYWTSKILTAEVTIQNPSAILNLAVEIVDTVSAKISWNAPQGFQGNNNVVSDLYYLIVSTSPIQNNVSYPTTKLTLLPLAPNTPQSIIIPSLNSGMRYYVAIYSQKVAFGKTKTSPYSNVVTFFTTAIEGNVNVPKRIPLYEDKIWTTTVQEAFSDGEFLTNILTFKRLAHQDYIIDNNGVPVGSPIGRVSAYTQYGGVQNTWRQVGTFKVIFELDGTYDLDYIYLWLMIGTDFHVYTSGDGVNLIKAFDKSETPISMNGMTKIPLANHAKTNIRFIYLGFFKGYNDINAFVPYGTRKAKYEIGGAKFKQVLLGRTMSEIQGTNGFTVEQNPELINKVSSFFRNYNPSDWVMAYGWRNTGFAIGKTPNDIMMKSTIELEHFVDIDTALTVLKNGGTKNIIFNINNSFQCLRAEGEVEKPWFCISVDPGCDVHDLTQTTNAMNFTFIARIAASIAYRWGSNVDAPEICNQFVTDSSGTKSTVKALGVITYVEIFNEIDRNWEGEEAYHNPQQAAAILSALYDGHKGQMGIGYGVKSADPNIKLVMAGLAGQNYSYIREMMLWWDLNRGEGDYPIDVYNFHHYNGYREKTENAFYELTDDAYAIEPELGYLMSHTHEIVRLRSLFDQNAEVWVTEFGYDEHYRGTYSPNETNPTLRARHKSVWILRSIMIYTYLGLDAVVQYWYADDRVRISDMGPQQVNRDIFLTSGLVEGISFANDRFRRPTTSYWYVVAFRNQLYDYKFSHLVVMKGVNKIVETDIINTYNPNLWVAAFVHKTTGAKKLVAWLGTHQWESLPVNIRVNNDVINVPVYDLINQDSKQSEYATQSNINPTINAGLKSITLNISETPTFIDTDLVGTPKLIEPKNIKIQPISSSSIKIAWTDENISNTNKARIYQSNSPTTGFTIVEEVYRDTAETTIAELSPNFQYFFRIQFVDGTKTSEISETIHATTFVAVNPPSNLRQDLTAITSSTVSLLWDYPQVEEANTDGFIVYQGISANGEFNEIGRVAPSVRTFRVFGLTPSTSFFYKVRTFKDAAVSAYTFAQTGTTTAPSLNPPTIQSASTNLVGSEIELYYNEDLKDEQTAINAFSIVENLMDGSILSHAVTGISIGIDKTKVTLKFDSAVFKNSTVTVSYAANIGALKSTNNIAVNSFTSFEVTNNTTDQFIPLTEWNELIGIAFNRNNMTSTGQARGVSQQKIAAGASAVIQWNTSMPDTFLVGLDQASNPEGFNTFDYYMAKVNNVVSWKHPSGGGTTAQAFVKGILRYETNGTSIMFKVSYDNGITFTTIGTVPQPNIDLYLKVYAGGTGAVMLNVVGKGLTGTIVSITPDAPTEMIVDDVANTVGFTLNPDYTLGQHEYCSNGLALIKTWVTVTSNPILVGDISVPEGAFAVRVKSGTGRNPSAPLVNTEALTGTINSDSKIMVQKSSGGTVLFGTNSLTELKTWLSTAVITQPITVQFNTADTYYVPNGFSPTYNNGLHWVTFQGAPGIRPIFDAQNNVPSVWTMEEDYTILRNIELRNANINNDSGCILRAHRRSNIKLLDIIYDRGFCACRAAEMTQINIEVDGAIIRNVINGAFRCNGISIEQNWTLAQIRAAMPTNMNQSYKNIWLDDVTNGGIIQGVTYSDGRFRAPMVIKLMDGVTVDGYRYLSGDELSFDGGEIELCYNAVCKNVLAKTFKWRITDGLWIENCFIRWEGGAQNELTNCKNISILHSFIDYINSGGSYSVNKLKGNIFKMTEKDSFFLTVSSSANDPVEESDNIFVAGSLYPTTYFGVSHTNGDPSLLVKEDNLADYLATGKGNNSIFLKYSERDLVNLNPWGSLRGNSVGKNSITATIEGITTDVYRTGRNYPTDPGPFNGLRPDVNDDSTAPTVSGDELYRTLVFSHAKYPSSEIVYSENGGLFVPYTGAITVADTAIPSGYYKAKIKAAPYRNESPLVDSPAFAEKPSLGEYEVLQTVAINFSRSFCSYGATNAFDAYSKTMPTLINTASATTGWGIETYVPFADDGCTIASPGTEGQYIIDGELIKSGMRAKNPPDNSKLLLTGLDNSKFYQFYIIAVTDDLNAGIKITINGQSISKVTTGNYPYASNGDMYTNPAVLRFQNKASEGGEIVIEFEKEGTAWPVALNYLFIEESNMIKP